MFLLKVSIFAFLFLALACGENRSPNIGAQVPAYTFDVVATWPHDPGAFTQGLEIYQGSLYESTGLYGSSSLRQVDLQTGRVIRRVTIPSEYFAEGITVFQANIYQFTSQSHEGFIYHRTTSHRLAAF